MEMVTRLHRCLGESRVACGFFFSSNSPAMVEMAVNVIDMDFAGIDLQHAPINAQDNVNLLRAIQVVGPDVTPVVRLPNHDVYWIQQSLDAGYTCLIVPLVESADEARALVRSTYFPPVGARSMAGSIRASLYGVEVAEMNQHTILLPQIESVTGLEHVEEILDVEGVTGILLGPEDLSLSSGWRGKDIWNYDPFLKAVERVLSACRERNKLAAILTTAYQEATRAGFDIIGIGGDLGAARVTIKDSINQKLKEMRQLGEST